MMKNILKLIPFILILALAGAVSCKKKGAPVVSRSDVPEMALIELYNYSPSSEFEERIGKMPDRLLELYRLMDERKDYAAYEPSQAEKALVAKYLRFLPPVFERVFREKCVGLYFVRGFAGNGLTSWVVDARGRLYFHMVLNPDALKNDLSTTLTEREKSCFLPVSGGRVSVNAGKKYKGLAYALFHEASHAVDYIEGVTLFAEPDFPERYRPPGRQPGDIFTGVWRDYSLPKPGNNYSLRNKITFYGLGGGPKLAFAEAPELYSGLMRSPFVSLYGSKSWAEDFAELIAFDMITRKLGQPYKITLSVPGARPLVFEPMRSSALIRAEKLMKRMES
ncbi:MAG: hypothetical protein KKH28_04015, partial [Elusimicrobia bacterium]|nr:hypothetical protein [Elusimicrobiota bacterium]